MNKRTHLVLLTSQTTSPSTEMGLPWDDDEWRGWCPVNRRKNPRRHLFVLRNRQDAASGHVCSTCHPPAWYIEQQQEKKGAKQHEKTA